MSKIMNIVKNPGIIGSYIKGVSQARRNRENVYQLRFVKEDDGVWYIDLPQWTGAHANLAMVCGSDMMLDHLAQGKKSVKIEAVKSNERLKEYDEDEDFCRCEQTEYSLLGGSTYNVVDEPGFDHTIWLCPVTLFVLGEYPKYIYVRNKN